MGSSLGTPSRGRARRALLPTRLSGHANVQRVNTKGALWSPTERHLSVGHQGKGVAGSAGTPTLAPPERTCRGFTATSQQNVRFGAQATRAGSEPPVSSNGVFRRSSCTEDFIVIHLPRFILTVSQALEPGSTEGIFQASGGRPSSRWLGHSFLTSVARVRQSSRKGS